MSGAPPTESLSHGERVSPQATGEGVRRFRLGLRPSNPSAPNTLTRLLRSHSLPEGEGLGVTPVHLGPVEAKDGRTHLIAAGRIEHAPDFLDDPIEPGAHVVIGEADLQVARGLDPFTPGGVKVRLLGVMDAIELDGEPGGFTGEIDDVAGDRDLPTEFPAVEPAIAELLPQQVLRGCPLGTQAARGCLDESRHSGVPGMRWREYADSSTPHTLTRLLRSHPLPQGEGLGEA
jgi:hypothetical protein